ncbi:MAG: hypothetical protein Kow00121_59840 [Elainellaceae cyanobacterium]
MVRKLTIILLAAIAIATGRLALRVAIERLANTDPATLTQVSFAQSSAILTSADGNAQLVLPPGWQEEHELNEAAILQASKLSDELYLVVHAYDKTDFAAANLQENAKVLLEDIKQAVRDAEVISLADIQSINGNPAIQHKVKATVDGWSIVFISTFVETSDRYYQIYAWTLASQFESSQAELQQAIQGFQEVQPAALSLVK